MQDLKIAPIEEALERVDLIVPRLALDVRRALASRAYLQASNEPVLDALAEVATLAADGHAQSQNAHRIMLSIELARIFDADEGRPIARQSKASLPVLAHYLGRADVQEALARRSRHNSRSERISNSIASFLRRWRRLEESPSDQSALANLKSFRNYEIAHSIFDRQPAYPTYAELFRLCSVAAGLTYRAEIAADADDTDFRLNARIYRQLSRSYWGAFTAGVLAINEARP